MWIFRREVEKTYTNIKLAKIGVWFAAMLCIEWWMDRWLLLLRSLARKPYNFVFKVYLLWCNSSHPFRLSSTSLKRQCDRSTWYPNNQCACVSCRVPGQWATWTAPKLNEFYARTWCDRPKNQFLIVCLHFACIWLNSADSGRDGGARRH